MAKSVAESLRPVSPPEREDVPVAVERMFEWVSRQSIAPLATLLVVIIGLGDLVTGIELPFTILYLLPISLGTWFRSRGFGIFLAALATCAMAISLVHEHLWPIAIAWNVIGAGVLFVTVIWVIEQLRRHVDRERALRRMAVAQLRHAERLNVIGTLAAGVAHELGTPLNVIAGCAEFLEEDSEDERVQRRSKMILDQVAKVSAIIRHLLDFGRRGGVVRERLDLNALASAAAELLGPAARKRGSSIALELEDRVFVTANARELEQVLSNLIVNAIQATDHGVIRVKVGRQRRGIDEVACLAVEDDGCGIPASDLNQIFDPFFTTKGVGEGTGLGLSVSYGIVHDHGGSIEVVSEPGRGSRFTVVLPLQA